jgi:hypothetical protein
MKTTKAHLVCLLLCLAVNLIFAADATKDDVAVEKKGDADNFFAARGRRSGEGDSSNGAASPDDFFWANRGKRSVVRVLRDQGNFNVPRPNGFFFPSAGKRASSYNIPRPNGFFFPSATGKRGMSRFFPKRSSFNLPRPNGFIFPSRNNGKRSESSGDNKETRKGQFWNLAKPNGFFFPSVPMPQSKRMSDEYEDVEEDTELYNLLSIIFSIPDVEEDEEIMNSKRDNFDESTFFACRGKRSDVDLDDAFFAGRGKKDSVDADLAAFFAGRGKKGGDVGDIFFAGRG